MPRPVRAREEPQCTWEEGPYSLRRARVVLDEMANYLCFIRDRLEAHADYFPVSPHRDAQLAFRMPYEVSTEMWQVATEAEVQLSDLIDRLEAAARVTQAELEDEFEELAEAVGSLSELGALVGASDHGATKSLYAKDPDGIEFEVLYRLPREAWGEWENAVTTRPLDLGKELERFGKQPSTAN